MQRKVSDELREMLTQIVGLCNWVVPVMEAEKTSLPYVSASALADSVSSVDSLAWPQAPPII